MDDWIIMLQIMNHSESDKGNALLRAHILSHRSQSMMTEIEIFSGNVMATF